MNIPALYITLLALFLGGVGLRRALGELPEPTGDFRTKRPRVAFAHDLIRKGAPAAIQALAAAAIVLETWATAWGIVGP